MKTNGLNQPTREAIAIRAFQIWAQEGQPVGNSERHWLQAEAELKNGGGAKANGRRAKRTAVPA